MFSKIFRCAHLLYLGIGLLNGCISPSENYSVKSIPVIDDGWARNSVNTVIFRKNALFTHDSIQFIGFYDAQQNLVLGKRRLGSSEWVIEKSPFKGNARDAHNSISLIVDQSGILHVAWDHHNTPLRYARGKSAHSLQLSKELPMVGQLEPSISYPEFYHLPQGGLLFFYRDGGSGNGNLIINRYDTKKKSWKRLQSMLIDGEGERNAYWQATVDRAGTVHVSWVWRASPDVASNHDLAYAKSRDGGQTWERSDGTAYSLPITASSAEYIRKIPQQSELINQTSIAADADGNPYVISYWKPAGSDVPQYHLAYHANGTWQSKNLEFRSTAFSLSGVGTKAIPISRPQIVLDEKRAHVIFRDAERGNKISVASSKIGVLTNWELHDLTEEGFASWEPTFDPVVWSEFKTMHLFVQKVNQVDSEGLSELSSSPISVLEWKPVN